MDAEEAVRIGIARNVVDSAELLTDVRVLTHRVAELPVSLRVATKKLLIDARMDMIHAVRAREEGVFGRLVGAPANLEALSAFQDERDPGLSKLKVEIRARRRSIRLSPETKNELWDLLSISRGL